MDYEDYVCGSEHTYDPEADLFISVNDNYEDYYHEDDEWDAWDGIVYEGEYIDTFDDRW